MSLKLQQDRTLFFAISAEFADDKGNDDTDYGNVEGPSKDINNKYAHVSRTSKLRGRLE